MAMRTDWMKRAGACLLWTLVLLLLLAGLDQLLVRVPVTSPVPLAVVTFYRDLRSRLVELAKGLTSAPAPVKPAKPAPSAPTNGAPPASIEGVLEQHQARPAIPLPLPPATSAVPKLAPLVKEQAPRYIFADDQGELHFAETLAEIPEQYRERAKVLGE
jgi:hypothetical protein